MTRSCGLASTAPIATASAAGRSLAHDGWRSSQGSRVSPVTIAASTADSWSVSTAAPITRPRMIACRRPGVRRRRTDASSAIGRNTAPSAMFTWYQSCWVSIADRP